MASPPSGLQASQEATWAMAAWATSRPAVNTTRSRSGSIFAQRLNTFGTIRMDAMVMGLEHRVIESRRYGAQKGGWNCDNRLVVVIAGFQRPFDASSVDSATASS